MCRLVVVAPSCSIISCHSNPLNQSCVISFGDDFDHEFDSDRVSQQQAIKGNDSLPASVCLTASVNFRSSASSLSLSLSRNVQSRLRLVHAGRHGPTLFRKTCPFLEQHSRFWPVLGVGVIGGRRGGQWQCCTGEHFCCIRECYVLKYWHIIMIVQKLWFCVAFWGRAFCCQTLITPSRKINFGRAPEGYKNVKLWFCVALNAYIFIRFRTAVHPC